MSPKLFNIFIDEVIRQWQDVLFKDFKIGNTVLNTILFADDQAIISESEADFQRAVNRLENAANGFNMRISTMKTKAMAFQGKNHIRCKIVIDNKTIEQVSSVKYLGFNVSYCLKEDTNIKLNKFQRMCGIIRRTLRQKTLQINN
jgi:polyphosphate kinase